MLPVSLTLVEHQCSPCSYDIHSLYSTPSWMNGKIHGLSGAAPLVVKHFDSVRNFRVEFMLISQDQQGQGTHSGLGKTPLKIFLSQ